MKTRKLGPLRSWACRLAGSKHETTVLARSPGDAKARFYHHLDGDFPYLDIRVRCDGPPMTTVQIRRNAEYRGVPFVRAGMPVEVDGQRGVIVGVNSSANWDVLFDQDSRWGNQVVNCHPTWEIVYFDDDGTVIKDFRSSGTSPTCPATATPESCGS